MTSRPTAHQPDAVRREFAPHELLQTTLQVDARPRPLRREMLVLYIQEKYGITYTVSWFAKLAVTGGGPPFRKVGRFPIYDSFDVDEWMSARTSVLKYSTSDRN